jgi:hypothetical protein
MQEIYIRDAGNWHQLDNMYVKNNGNWHAVSNVYTKYDGNWHLTWSPEIETTSFLTPGTHQYTVPAGVYNLNVTYPTPATLVTTTVTNVWPGQVIPVNIGTLGSTSSFLSVTAPAFETQVVSWAGPIDIILTTTISVATPTGVTYTYNGLNSGVLSPGATAAGARYDVLAQSDHGDLTANLSLTPVPNSVLIGSNTKAFFSAYSGPTDQESISEVTLENNMYVVTTTVIDDHNNERSFSYTLKLQQVSGMIISPTGPS